MMPENPRATGLIAKKPCFHLEWLELLFSVADVHRSGRVHEETSSVTSTCFNHQGCTNLDSSFNYVASFFLCGGHRSYHYGNRMPFD